MKNQAPEKKPGLLKRILGSSIVKKLASDTVRGSIKSFPFGGWIYQVIALVRYFRKPKDARGPLPHSPVSVLIQFAWLCLIVYGLLSKEFSVAQALSYFDFSADDFKQFFAAPADVVQ